MNALPTICPDCGGFLRAHFADLRQSIGILWCAREQRYVTLPLDGRALQTLSTHARWNQASGTVPWPWYDSQGFTSRYPVPKKPKKRKPRRRPYVLPW